MYVCMYEGVDGDGVSVCKGVMHLQSPCNIKLWCRGLRVSCLMRDV